MDKNLRYSRIQSFSNCGLKPANSESPRTPFSDGCDERPPFRIECLWWGWRRLQLHYRSRCYLCPQTPENYGSLCEPPLELNLLEKLALINPHDSRVVFHGKDYKFCLKSSNLIMLFRRASLILSVLPPFLTTCIGILSSLPLFLPLLSQNRGSLLILSRF